jgi:hypothetical protein
MGSKLAQNYPWNSNVERQICVYINFKITTRSHISVKELIWQIPMLFGGACSYFNFPSVTWAQQILLSHTVLSLGKKKLTTMLYALRPGQCHFIKFLLEDLFRKTLRNCLNFNHYGFSSIISANMDMTKDRTWKQRNKSRGLGVHRKTMYGKNLS